MSTLMELAERGILPAPLIRLGIRLLDRVRLRTEARTARVKSALDA